MKKLCLATCLLIVASITINAQVLQRPGQGRPWERYLPGAKEDGKPLESKRFILHSDSASEEDRKAALAWAEEVFDEFGVTFDLGNPPKELRFPPGQTKIDIFLNQGYDQRFGGASYYAGTILHPPGHKNLEVFGDQRAALSRATLRHELMHVLEMLLKGGEGPGLPPWFREGIASTWQPRSVRHPKIQTLEELESTLKEAQLGERELDPIGQVSDEDYYSLIQRIPWLNRIYYRLFDLSFRYLVDKRGLGKSYVDAKALYLDLRAGSSFPAAFTKRIGGIRVAGGFPEARCNHLWIPLWQYHRGGEKEGHWMPPLNISDILNITGDNAKITPDGKYMFFLKSGRKIYCMDAGFIEELRKKELHED